MFARASSVLASRVAAAALAVVSCQPGVPAATAAGDTSTATSPTAPPVTAPEVGERLPEGARDVRSFVADHPDFGSYWYRGLAEMDRYALTQARYGELHPGEAVLIYVTEDFLTDVQTKHEFGDATNAIPVLKLNASRRFYTGVYPYSLLTSVFLPVGAEADPAIKVAFGAQEWCGTTYQQFNLRDGEYDVTLHSYFQAEADQELRVSGPLEDELWVRVRRGPQALPVGTVSLVPPAHALRMHHRPTRPETAVGTLSEVDRTPRGPERAMLYELRYSGWGRAVRLWVEPEFPFRVLAWEEDEPAWGDEGEPLTTSARLTHSVMLDYWARHGADDGAYRELLGLEF